MEATPGGDGENILPQVQKQSSLTWAIILSAVVVANTNTVQKLRVDHCSHIFYFFYLLVVLHQKA